MSLTMLGFIYGVILLGVVTGSIWFVVRRFTREGQTRRAARAAIKLSCLLYPLGVGTLLITTTGRAVFPRVIWKVYLLGALGWTIWSLLNPRLSSVRSSLNQQFKGAKFLFSCVLAILGLILLPAVIIVSIYAFSM